jgi:hypothetical protein
MGLLAAAGFITGEALMGIGLAVPVAVQHDENALALARNAKGEPAYANLWPPSLIFVAIILILLYYLAFKRERTGRPPQTTNPKA